jgi:hypothetical protein
MLDLWSINSEKQFAISRQRYSTYARRKAYGGGFFGTNEVVLSSAIDGVCARFEGGATT